MKTLLIGLLLLGFTGVATAESRAKLDSRIEKLSKKLELMQQKPEKRIPAEHLRKAKGIVLLDRTKAGFLFAYQGGAGVAMVKDKSGQWGPAAFVEANEASLGFQIGGQQSFIVILLMTTNATQTLTEANIEFGGEARGTAGNTSAGVEEKVASSEAQMLVYSDRKGLFGGAAIKGGAIAPDEEANLAYYGEFLTMRDILFDRKVKATETARNLARNIKAYAEE